MRSGETLGGFLTLGGRLLIPVFFIAILFFLSVVSFTYGVLGAIRAPLFLMAVFYWSVYRPSLMPVWLAFLAGLVLDLLCGLPVGLSAIAFLLTRWIIAGQRKFMMAQPFIMLWSIFAVIALGAGLLQWALFGLVNLGWTPLVPALLSAGLGIALFPFVSTLLHLTHKVLPAGSTFGS